MTPSVPFKQCNYNTNGTITDVGTGSIGVGGSQGAFVEFDGSGASNTDLPRLNLLFGSAKTTVPTTTDLSKVEFSIDLAQSGSKGTTANLWATLFGLDSSLNNLFIVYSPNLTTGSGFTTFTSTLDT